MANAAQRSKRKAFIGVAVSVVLLGLAAGLFLYNPASKNPSNARLPMPKETAIDAERLIREPAGGLTITYPLNGSIFPPEFPPPVVSWNDRSGTAARWLVAFITVDGQSLGVSRSTESRLALPPRVWAAIKNKKGRAVTMLVAGFASSPSEDETRDSAVSSATVCHTSSFPMMLSSSV